MSATRILGYNVGDLVEVEGRECSASRIVGFSYWFAVGWMAVLDLDTVLIRNGNGVEVEVEADTESGTKRQKVSLRDLFLVEAAEPTEPVRPEARVVEIQKIATPDDPNYEHCWVASYDGKVLEYGENPPRSIFQAKKLAQMRLRGPLVFKLPFEEKKGPKVRARKAA